MRYLLNETSGITTEHSSNTQCGSSSTVLVGIRAERLQPRCIVGNHSPVSSVPYCTSCPYCTFCGNGRSSLNACIQSAENPDGIVLVCHDCSHLSPSMGSIRASAVSVHKPHERCRFIPASSTA